MRVNLFYLSPNTTGGWVTFTAHLMEGLRQAGADPLLYKVGPRTREYPREFGYGEKYLAIERVDAMVEVAKREGPSLIVAVAKKFREAAEDLYYMGAKLVVHDPTEYKNLPEGLEPKNCILVRPSGKLYAEGARVIIHPYCPFERDPSIERTKTCISTSRIDFDKNTAILLDANRILPTDLEIDIRGFENRLYTKFAIMPNYPEWLQSIVAYPRTKEAAFRLLCESKWSADMSVIKGDGGGTQYTTLEAWNAGAAVIIHQDWIRAETEDEDEMQPGINCHAVRDGEELADLLEKEDSATEEYRQYLVEGGEMALRQHDAKTIAEQYLEFLHESDHST